MGRFIEIEQGQTLLSVANDAGVADWERVWLHAQNAGIRSKRANPQVLAPGDRLYLPGPEELRKPYVKPTGFRHVFQVLRPPCFFSVFLFDEGGEPYAGRKYKLKAGDRTFEGQTGSDGSICHPVDPDVEHGELTFWRSDDPADSHSWTVKIGHLNPCDTLTGVKARLKNLGFLEGPADESLDEETKAAIRAFQQYMGEPPTGELDSRTRAALVSMQNDH